MTRWRSLLVSIILTLGACVAVFQDARQSVVQTNRRGCEMNTFTAYAQGGLDRWQKCDLAPAWRSRFMSGRVSALFVPAVNTYPDLVGLQAAFWMAIVGLALYLTGRAHHVALGLLLCVAASVYNSSTPPVQVLLSWDYPLMAFSALAVAGYARRWRWLTLVSILCMLLFKESALVFVPLLFGPGWPTWRRLLVWVVPGALLMLALKYSLNLTVGLRGQLTTTDMTISNGFPWYFHLVENLTAPALIRTWPLTNCATVLLALCFAQRWHWPVVLVYLLSLAGNLACGYGLELRVFFELAPLAAFLIGAALLKERCK